MCVPMALPSTAIRAGALAADAAEADAETASGGTAYSVGAGEVRRAARSGSGGASQPITSIERRAIEPGRLRMTRLFYTGLAAPLDYPARP